MQRVLVCNNRAVTQETHGQNSARALMLDDKESVVNENNQKRGEIYEV